MLNHSDIMSTVDMIDHQHLDIRTITMGISLLDCADPDPAACARKIHDKICRQAEHLVATGCQIERELGIPIVNKRISVTPIALVASACETEDFVPFARAMDQAAKTCGVDFIGGFSALVHKGMASGDRRLIAAIPQALAETELVCSSVNVATTKAGINMDAVRLMGQAIKQTAELTKDRDGLGCAKLVVFCNAVEDNPFMAGAFHGVGEADAVVSVGVSGPGVVHHALQAVKGRPFDEVAECIKKTAFRITRVGQLVAQEASRRLGVPFGVVDLSLAPTPAVGDSVARILEEMGLAVCGTHGTTAALAMLNDAVKKGGLMASSSVGGLSGAFIPVSEDEGMIAAARSGVLTLDKLEAMTCVCSVGLDMIAVPGDTECGDDLRHHRGRGRRRHGQLQDDRRAPDPRAGQAGRRRGLVRRAARRGAHHAGASGILRRLHRPRRPHPGPDAEPQKLKAAAKKTDFFTNTTGKTRGNLV